MIFQCPASLIVLICKYCFPCEVFSVSHSVLHLISSTIKIFLFLFFFLAFQVANFKLPGTKIICLLFLLSKMLQFYPTWPLQIVSACFLYYHPKEWSTEHYPALWAEPRGTPFDIPSHLDRKLPLFTFWALIYRLVILPHCSNLKYRTFFYFFNYEYTTNDSMQSCTKNQHTSYLLLGFYLLVHLSCKEIVLVWHDLLLTNPYLLFLINFLFSECL